MKCLILAAGYATRLYPLTENFPKPLLKVQNKTILDWLIDDIDGSGLVDEYVVISNSKFAGHFSDWANERNAKGGTRITVLDDGTSTNETRLGAVKDIQFALDHLSSPSPSSSLITNRSSLTPPLGAGGLSSPSYLVIAGDNVLDFSLQHFVRYAVEKQTSCVMRFYEADEKRLLKCGVVTVDDNDRIIRMTEKSPTPETHWVCPPFYYYTAEDAQRIPAAIADGCGVDAPGSFIAWLCRQTTVHAMEMPGKRYDIGNIESYNQVQTHYPGIVL